MSRSKYKIPFSKFSLQTYSTKWIEIYNKNLVIIPKFINSNFNIYNGKTFIKLKIIPEMVGYKLGEFINTKKRNIYKKKKK